MATKQKGSGLNKMLVFIAVLVVLVIGGLIAWNTYKYKFINSKVRTAVFEKTNGLYIIRYDKMDVDEVAGYLHVINLQIIPDTARFRQMVLDKRNPPLLLALTIPDLKVTGVKTPQAMLDKKIIGRRLEISNANVVFYYAKGHKGDSANDKEKGEMYQQLLGNLKEIKADTVEVTNTSVSFIDIRNNRKTVEATDISVHLKDVLIDSLHSDDTSRFFFAKQVQVTAEKGLVKNKTGTYFYRFSGINFSNTGGVFTVKSMEVEPQLSEERNAEHARLQTDRFNVSVRNVALKHINLLRLMETDVVADSFIIKDFTLKAFRDLSFPRDKKIRVGTFPQQLLMELPITLSLKKIVFGNGFIEYKEKNPKSDYSGRVQFTHANAVISNVTNDSAEIKADKNCVLLFNARFLDMVSMHARINMLLNDPKGRFSFSGSMNGFEANRLNVLMEPMGLARIEKGRINKVDFSFNGHDYGSDGKLTLLYDDLKITLLKKDSAENKLKEEETDQLYRQYDY